MKKRTILIVDDEADVLLVAKARFEANNFNVITAASGEEALEKVKNNKPDVVLLDVMMPELDGLRVLKKIRETDPMLPVFIFTAFSNEERFRLANKLNASGFILKTENLQNEIRNIIAVMETIEEHRA